VRENQIQNQKFKIKMSDTQLILGNCLEIMPTLKPGTIDIVITDPPYGVNKADFDQYFPKDWFYYAHKLARTVVIITGPAGLPDSISLVGTQFIDVISARNLNGMTKGPMGFNNWLAAVVSGDKPKKLRSWNAFDFVVKEKKPDHPSPKPIDYMTKLVTRLTNEGETILDPFMGSGSTGIACLRTNRNFIGIEINPQYFNVAQKRINQENPTPYSLLAIAHNLLQS